MSLLVYAVSVTVSIGVVYALLKPVPDGESPNLMA